MNGSLFQDFPFGGGVACLSKKSGLENLAWQSIQAAAWNRYHLSTWRFYGGNVAFFCRAHA